MAGPIASLVIRVSAQIADLQKDFKQASDVVRGFGSEFKNIDAKLSSFTSGLKGVAGAVGVAFSAQAVVGFVSHVIDAASKIKDLSTQLGISKSAVQGFKFAAEQSGSTLDAVGTAIQKMNQNLAGGDASTVGALKQAGLRFEDIRRMRPEDAFLEITDAIQQIEDPMIRARVALELFGRGAAELLPAIDAGMRKVSDGADKMSDDTIRALEEAGDAWSKLGNQATIVSGSIIGNLLSVGKTVDDVLSYGVPHAVDAAMLALTEMNEELARTVKAAAAFAGGSGKPGQFTPTSNVEEILRLSGEMSIASHKEAKGHSAAADAGNKHADAIKRLREELSGDGAIKAANEMIQALRGLPSVQFLAADQQARVNRAMQEATEAYRSQGREVPPLIRMISLASMDLANAIPVVHGLSNEFERLGQVIAVTATEAGRMVPIVEGLGGEFARIGQQITPVAEDVGRDSGESFGESFKGALQQSAAQIPRIIANAFAEGGGGLQQAVEEIGISLGQTLGAAIGNAVGGPVAGAIGKELGGFAGSFLDNVFKLDQRAVNDARDKFLLQFGRGGLGADSGFHQLAGQLHELGAEGDALFQKLIRTEDMSDFQRAMADVTAALKDQKAAVVDVGTAAEDAGAAQVAASSKALDAIKAMDDELSSLFKSIENEAPEEIMGVIESNTRARIAAVQRERDVAQQAINATGEAGARIIKTLRDELTHLDGTDVTFNVKWNVPGLPGQAPVPTLATLGDGSTQPIVVQSQLIVDGDVLAETLVKTLKRQGVR